MSQPPASEFPLELADRCVKCGLCLPYCPTYELLRDEGDSPRGRIALMQGLASARLAPSDALISHLDRCLTCRNCERVCPADVPYGQLIDAAREIRTGSNRATIFARLVASILTRPRMRWPATAILRLASGSGLLAIARRWAPARWRRLARRIPRHARPWKPPAPAPAPPPRDQVSLFTGCLPPLIDGRTIEDAILVLRTMGAEVALENTQRCCGALDLHAGRAERAREFAQANLSAFSGAVTPVLGLATGCTATLSEYASLFEGGESLAGRVQDIITWIAQQADRLPRLALQRETRCLVHYPCSQTNVLRDRHSLASVLDRIENLRWRPLETGQPGSSCCGGAGSYMISQPEMADALADRLLSGIRETETSLLVSGNIGCALHLQATLDEQGSGISVLHPVSLIARALPPIAA